MRSRNGKFTEDDDDTEEEIFIDEDDADVDTLLDAILTLDDQYKAGELPEDAYLKRRAELKAQIKEKMGS